MYISLIQNAALLLALTAIYGLLTRVRRGREVLTEILAGLLFGGVAVAGMLMPFKFASGIIYDGRSIVIAMAGLFGGWGTAAVSVVVAGSYRAYLGGPGLWAGLATIISCAMVGLAFRRAYGNQPERLSILSLYGFGIIVHIVMLACQLLLIPWPTGLAVISRIWQPILLIFPFASMLMGLFLGQEEHRIQTERKLSASESLLHETQEISKIGGWDYDVKKKRLTWTDEVFRIYELPPSYDPNSSQSDIQFFEPGARKTIETAFYNAVEHGDPYDLTLPFITAKGNNLWVRTVGKAELRHGKPVRVVGTIMDITERKKSEEELQLSEERYRSVVENIGIGISLISPNMEILALNKQMKTWFPHIDVSSRPICYRAFNDPPREEICSYCPTCKTLQDGQVHEAVTETPAKDKVIFFRLISSPVRDQDGKIIAAIEMVEDITERKQMEERLQYLAYYDALTDLPNRNLFLDRVNQAIARAEPMSRVVAVLITNIDRFKSINDTYGSEIGDKVLKEIAGRLSASVRKGDTIARLSNDEFGIALLDVAHPDDIVMVLEKIMKDISYPLNIAGDELALTFSTGVSLYPNDGENAAELLKSAGLALSIAKKEGGKISRFYTEDMNIKAAERMLLEKQLAKAYENKEFILHYQPYWDITTKKMVGMEALVRWQSKDKGLVPPGKFIPVLEETGLIIEVGEWILREAIRQVKEWQNKRYPVVPVSVNLSLIQFRQRNLADMVTRLMARLWFFPIASYPGDN